LAAGDTVYFKGGVTYVLTASYKGSSANIAGIALNWNGAVGNPITYDGNSAGTWGTGRAIFTDNYSTNGMWAFLAQSGLSNVTFRNLEIGPIGGSASLPADPGYAISDHSGAGIGIYSSGQNITVDNCYFHQLGYWFNQKPMNDACINGCAFQVVNPSGVTVANCEFTKCNLGCEIIGSLSISNVTIANCNFHNYLRWCIDLAVTADGTKVDAVFIHDNQLHDYEEYDAQNWTGYGSDPHSDGIFHRADYAAVYGTNINFYNNFFYSTGSGGGGTAPIYLSAGTSANIYNNVFSHPGKTRVIYLNSLPPRSGQQQVVRIYNNTIIESYLLALNIDSGGGPNQVLDVKNNIFYDTFTGSSANFPNYVVRTTNNPMPLWVFDSNGYYTRNPYKLVFQWDPYGYWDLSGDQSAWGWESHGQFTDPLFVNISQTNGAVNGTFNGWNLLDLHLRANSPFIGKGVNLSSLGLPGLNADKDGNPRPSSGPWDIGAYTVGSNAPPVVDTTSPTILVCALAATSAANANGQATVPDFTGGVQATEDVTPAGSLVKTQSPAAGTVVRTGTTPVTVTVSDAAGNSTSCNSSFTVTIVATADLTPPTIIACAWAITNSADANGQGKVPDFTAGVQATDNSTQANLLIKTQSPPAGTLVGAGTTPVTITVRDVAGNAVSCNSSFTVNDTTPLSIIVCAGPLANEVKVNGQVSVPDFTAAVQATDNVTPAGSLVKTQSPTAGTVVGVGTTPVTITVRDAAGNVATCSTTFTAKAIPPGADFSAAPKNGQVPFAASFSNLSTGTITGVAWDFGDGSTSTEAQPTHTYTKAADYSVSLTVFGPAGTNTLKRDAFIPVSNPQAPVILAAPTVTTASLQFGNELVIVAGDTNVFTVVAMDPGGNPLNYQWSFGDGVTNDWSLSGTAQHVYTTNCGSYAASVAVSNAWSAISGNLTVTVACQLNITKLQPKLNFVTSYADSCLVKGQFDLPSNYSFSGKVATLNIGGAQVSFPLDNLGRGHNGSSTFNKPSYNKKTGLWTFNASLRSGSWQAPWATYGMANLDATKPGVMVNDLPVILLLDSEAFLATTNLQYTATQNVTGTAK
jgi:PKD repeat protein